MFRSARLPISGWPGAVSSNGRRPPQLKRRFGQHPALYSSIFPKQEPEHLNGRLYGQPTAETHSHLLHKGEVTPGITMEEYRGRRERFVNALVQYAAHMTQQTKMHVAIIPSATKVYMSENIPYPFRQNSDFFYLTGFTEPDSVLVLKTSSSGSSSDLRSESVIFVPKHDRQSELWDGPRTGRDGAVSLLGVESAHDMDELPSYLGTLFRHDARQLALWCDQNQIPQPFVDRTLRAVTTDAQPKFWNSSRPIVQQLRLLKSPAEATLLRRSCDATADAFIRTIAATKPGVSEHQLYARTDYECRMAGADRLAYPPVVAGGDRANVIHYVANSQRLAADDMVLMDAGCEFHGYVSDVTRTWPVSPTFVPAHRALYEALLEVQTELIGLCKDRPSLDQLYSRMLDMLGRSLQKVGVIHQSVGQAERNKMVQKFCPHHVSHYLGLDVHDTPLIPRSRILQPGMVITVEPGVYIRKDDYNVPLEFRGVGLRIEDNVLITDEGLTVLSSKCPKTVTDIETIRTTISGASSQS